MKVIGVKVISVLSIAYLHFIRMEPSTNQVKEAVYIKAIDKWREVIPLNMQKTMYRTAPLLQQLGYK